jgi:hypothetical protein
MRKLGRFMNCLRLFICHLAVYVCARDRGIFHLGMYYISLPPPPPHASKQRVPAAFLSRLQEKLLYDPPTSTPCLGEHLEQRKWRLKYYRSWDGGGGDWHLQAKKK